MEEADVSVSSPPPDEDGGDAGPPDTDLDESNAASLRPHATDRVVVPTQWQSKVSISVCVSC